MGREDLTLKIKTTSPFNITGNSELNSFSTGGDGTIGNPYVIENYVINATGLGVHGIFINDTDAYFTLRNCTIVGSDASFAGIALLDVLHGTLFNNTVQYCDYGITLQRSNQCLIEKNQVNNNTLGGIYLWDNSHYNLIRSNLVSNNTWGIDIGSNWVNVFNNTVGPNNGWGIITLHAFGNIIGNNIFNNTIAGLGLEAAGWNNVTDNLVQNNERGIWCMMSTSNNLFYHNLIWFNNINVINESSNTWIENLYNVSGDFDGDGLININETIWKTSCFLIDSDFDNLNDTFEIFYGTIPSNNDTDYDGLLDGAELLTYLTNATNPDTDGDGFLDGIEVAAGTDPNDPLSFPTEPPGIPGFGLYFCVISLIVIYRISRKCREAPISRQV